MSGRRRYAANAWLTEGTVARMLAVDQLEVRCLLPWDPDGSGGRYPAWMVLAHAEERGRRVPIYYTLESVVAEGYFPRYLVGRLRRTGSVGEDRVLMPVLLDDETVAELEVTTRAVLTEQCSLSEWEQGVS